MENKLYVYILNQKQCRHNKNVVKKQLPATAVTEAAEVRAETEPQKGAEVIKASEVMEASEVTEASEVMEVTEVTVGPAKTKPPGGDATRGSSNCES